MSDFIFRLSLGILFLFTGIHIHGQPSVIVDENAIMRWKDSGAEVCGFGVNYPPPFAHGYVAHKHQGIEIQKSIDADVYHFARMGLDAYRIHVWDSEISDSAGNLVLNEHLEVFDYLLSKLKERDIKIFLTPMNYYNRRSSKVGMTTPGFVNHYDKVACLTDTASFSIQENYLFQFVSHVNPYTGLAYKDDPDIIAFEVNNEPHFHRDRPDLTTEYINRMVGAIRRAGCRKPVFYNLTHSCHLIDEFCNANIQGGTFQWYPTGLTANHDQKGNILPNVDVYTIPFASHPGFAKLARMVYEFSPSDVGQSSHLYPAMARSFRTAGIQYACHFAYDPLYMAYANTDYKTHYLNLAFAPRKALGMKIASEVFHRVPLGSDYGRYPSNTSFDAFRLSYEDDLAEMLTEKKFLYTNNTQTNPPDPERLEHIAGYGNSPVVSYDGCGAYFIDRIEEGVWRLEVMPDAVWVRDPFVDPNYEKEVSVILWKEWPISIALPDIGEGFGIVGLNEGNSTDSGADGISFTISPGSYLLKRKGASTEWRPDDSWGNIRLNEFAAPPATCRKTYVLHEPSKETSAGNSFSIDAKIVSPFAPEKVEIIFFGKGLGNRTMTMEHVNGYDYKIQVPPGFAKEKGYLNYYIMVYGKNIVRTFPSDVEGHPGDWDFYAKNPWRIRVVEPAAPVYLFDASQDADQVTKPTREMEFELIPSPVSGKSAMLIRVDNLESIQFDNLESEQQDLSLRSFFRHEILLRKDDLESKKELVVLGESLNGRPCRVQFALIMENGMAHGGVITLNPERDKYRLSLEDLRQVRTVNLPRAYPAYPGFLPYWFESGYESVFDIQKIESLQISIGPGIPEIELALNHGIALESVWLE